MVYTLSDIREQVLDRADMPKSEYTSVKNLNFLINQSQDELYDLLVGVYDDYFMSSVQFSLNGTTDGYDVTDLKMYKLRGVDRQISGPNSWGTLYRFNFNERNKYTSPYGAYLRNPILVEYALIGNTLKIIPEFQNNGTYRLSYVPDCTPLDDGYNTTLDPLFEKWVDYIIVDVAIKVLNKEQSDTSVLMAQKQALKIRIESMAPNRDDNQPKHVSDSNMYDGGFNGGYWRRF